MSTIPNIKDLLEAGVHFGHQTRKWNPLMKKYIFAERNGIYIIDLQKTVKAAKEAYEMFRQTAAQGEHILFVGTKRQAQDSVREAAERCGMYYVTERWLGGMLTNFKTIQSSIHKMKEIEKMREDGTFEALPKKEVLQLERKHEKLERILGGVRDMTTLPGALFVVDIRKEDIAVAEAKKLGIPVAAMVDTNCNPNEVEYVIPSNDDAIRAIRLFSKMASDAVLEGKQRFEKIQTTRKDEENAKKKRDLEKKAKKISIVEEVEITEEGGTKKKERYRKRKKRARDEDRDKRHSRKEVKRDRKSKRTRKDKRNKGE